MPGINVYVPDDLHKQIKARPELPVSAICRSALRAELERRDAEMKTSIYLPDDLAEQVRAHGISISAVTQTALRHAVKAAGSNGSAGIDVRTGLRALREDLLALEKAIDESEGNHK